MKPKDMLTGESISLPREIRDKEATDIQISFRFKDGSYHHVMPKYEVSKKMCEELLKINGPFRHLFHLKNWEFLEEEDIKI